MNKNATTDNKMRAILTCIMAMPQEQFAAFVPKNQKETAAKALVDKANTGDIKAIEFIMKTIGDMPTKKMESETDSELESNPFSIFPL